MISCRLKHNYVFSAFYYLDKCFCIFWNVVGFIVSTIFSGAIISILEFVFILCFMMLGGFSVLNTFWPFIYKPFLLCISDAILHLPVECTPEYRMLTHQHDHTHESIECLNSETLPIYSLFISLCLLHLMLQFFVSTLM
jgi:hypothetical protein